MDQTPPIPFLLPIEFDLVATFLGAITGAWAASRRGYDLVGVSMIAFVSSIGGGLMRDSVFLLQIPVVMQYAEYLWTILAAIVAGVLAQRYSGRFVHLFAYTDALALGVYGVYGANRALIAGLSPEGAVVVGLCNAVGGGLVRDILTREEPIMFKPGQLYTLAALAGCLLFVVLSARYGVETTQAAWVSIFLAFLLRLLAIRFDWTTRSVRDWIKRDGA